jgi:mRNA interferase RelE/StbE
MRFRVELGSKAFQALSKLDKTNKSRVFKKLKSLEETPFPVGSRKIEGEENVYRLRSGDMRILYKLMKSEKVVLIFKIEKRGKAYD